MADGESEFGVLTGILSSRKNVPRKMWRYTENGDELSGDKSRVNCTSLWSVEFSVCVHHSGQ